MGNRDRNRDDDNLKAKLDEIESDLSQKIHEAASKPVEQRHPDLSQAHKDYNEFMDMRYPDRHRRSDDYDPLEGTR